MWTETRFQPLPQVQVCLVRTEGEPDERQASAFSLLADTSYQRPYANASARRMTEGRAAVFALCCLLQDACPQRSLNGVLRRSAASAPILSDGIGYCALTHDQGCSAAAFAPRPVGIDLLRSGRKSALRPLSRYLELSLLERLPEEERDRTAAVLWTQLEAYGKLLGVGLSMPKESLPTLSVTEAGCSLQRPGVIFSSMVLEDCVWSAAVFEQKDISG